MAAARLARGRGGGGGASARRLRETNKLGEGQGEVGLLPWHPEPAIRAMLGRHLPFLMGAFGRQLGLDHRVNLSTEQVLHSKYMTASLLEASHFLN